MSGQPLTAEEAFEIGYEKGMQEMISKLEIEQHKRRDNYDAYIHAHIEERHSPLDCLPRTQAKQQWILVTSLSRRMRRRMVSEKEVRVVYRPYEEFGYAVFVGDKLIKLYSFRFLAIRKAKQLAKTVDAISYSDYTVWSSKEAHGE